MSYVLVKTSYSYYGEPLHAFEVISEELFKQRRKEILEYFKHGGNTLEVTVSGDDSVAINNKQEFLDGLDIKKVSDKEFLVFKKFFKDLGIGQCSFFDVYCEMKDSLEKSEPLEDDGDLDDENDD
jgi:hypothetical protein